MDEKQMKTREKHIAKLELEDQRKIYKAYVCDATKISLALEEHLEQNLELFRVEVHGIKSMSRQLGYMQMGDVAENMEMAAKEQNFPFLLKNLNHFLEELRIIISDAQENLNQIEKKLQERGKTEEQKLPCHADKAKLFMDLKEAFLCFELDNIEQIISGLKNIPLNEEEQELLMKVSTCAEDLEYERAIRLIEELE